MVEVTGVQGRVLDAVDERWTVDRLRRLVAVPTFGGTPAECEVGDPFTPRLADGAVQGRGSCDRVPTLHYGPGDLRLAHGPLERVPVAEVLVAARALALLTLRCCRAR